MIIFKTLKLRNFLSFGNRETIVNFNEPGSIHLIGENLDVSPTSASGAGKTTIYNAITYAIYNKALTNISKELLINSYNSDKKQTRMEVELEFEKDGVGYIIRRWRGDSNGALLLIDGEDKTPATVIDIDKKVQEIIGMSYELFTRVVIFQGRAVSFFDLPVKEQRNLLEELFGITILSEKAEKLRENQKALDKNITILTTTIDAQEKATTLRLKHISDAETRITRFEESRITQLKALKEQLEVAGAIGDLDEQIKINEEIYSVKYNLEVLSKEEKKTLESVNTLQQSIIKLQTDHVHLNNGECPYCNQSFKNEDKIKDNEILLIEAESKQKEQNDYLLSVKDSIANQNECLRLLKARVTIQNVSALAELKNSIIQLQFKFDDLTNQINPHIESYDSLLTEDNVKPEYERLDEMKVDYTHGQFLLKLLTDKNSFIRKRIINKNVPLLNKKILFYTNELGLPHNITFTPDMNVNIREFDRELSFGNLSGGESCRVNIALSLAFRDVLTFLHSSNNLILTDELDAGTISSESLDALAHLLKAKSRDEQLSVWVVSHRVEIAGRFDQTLTVRKQHGFSELVH